ncbi:hypothetical protein GL297_12535 [Komagataeibacter sp. FXV2]|nr:hypothetical protein [Komagataeibacter sp. FXV2]
MGVGSCDMVTDTLDEGQGALNIRVRLSHAPRAHRPVMPERIRTAR